MRDRDLYARILGIESPWRVRDVELHLTDGEVVVHVAMDPEAQLVCPHCGKPAPRYDKRSRKWRHLDTCQYRTVLSAEVPRIACPEHGVSLITVPWAEPGSRYTALFEALVIDWLKEAPPSAVSRQLGVSWNAIDGIMQRAVARGLKRRRTDQRHVHLCVDETSFRKRHDYVTVVTDRETGEVIHVGEDRKKETLEAFYAGLDETQKAAIESVSMDMWPACIQATLDTIPGAAGKIAFDKFHVAKALGEAVDKVRRQEHKALLREGNAILKGSKHAWLTNPANMSRRQWRDFATLRTANLKTARAWAIKEQGMSLWHYVHRTWAEKGWKRWYDWAIRSRLEPVKKVARMVRKHLWGILNAIMLKASNGLAESTNSRIQLIKLRSRGFRNKDRFQTAIYFHLGGLDLYPNSNMTLRTHTI
jgi:transposase